MSNLLHYRCYKNANMVFCHYNLRNSRLVHCIVKTSFYNTTNNRLYIILFLYRINNFCNYVNLNSGSNSVANLITATHKGNKKHQGTKHTTKILNTWYKDQYTSHQTKQNMYLNYGQKIHGLQDTGWEMYLPTFFLRLSVSQNMIF